jgi:hypothetical protein
LPSGRWPAVNTSSSCIDADRGDEVVHGGR